MGNVWERQFKTTMKILTGQMEECDDCLDEESFCTSACEVDAIINSRLLKTVPGGPDNLEAL